METTIMRCIRIIRTGWSLATSRFWIQIEGKGLKKAAGNSTSASTPEALDHPPKPYIHCYRDALGLEYMQSMCWGLRPSTRNLQG